MMKKILVAGAIVLGSSAGVVQAQAPVADFYSQTSLLDGTTLPAGTTIEAFDANGIRCGFAQANSSGGFLVHVYGNDPMTPGIDEGATEGEMLQWKLAGTAVDNDNTYWITNLIGTFADLRWENGAAKEMRLEGRTMAVENQSWSAVKTRFRR
jgi:hypothetical protein